MTGRRTRADVHGGGRPTAVAYSGVGKRFGRLPVLSDFSLEVRAGEIFGLVGPNGAGKSTCIKCMLDLCHVDAGRITIFGRPASSPQSRRPVVYLPERFKPPRHLRGEEFLRFMAKMHRVDSYPGRVLEVCGALGLAPSTLEKPIWACSTGTVQAIGLAACFLAGKPLLVFDEPMSGLDPKARMLAARHLTRLRNGGATVFFSTHMLSEAADLCDRMGVLHDGAMRFVGSPARLRECFPAATLEESWLACVSRPT